METYIGKVTNSTAKKLTSRIALAELVIGLYTLFLVLRLNAF